MTELRLVERSEWRPTVGTRSPMVLPALGLVVHHTVTRASSSPVADARTLEAIGLARKLGGFPYCYAVHPSGAVIVGAGLTIGAHTKGYNSRWVGVAFIGNFMEATPTAAARAGFIALARRLASTGQLVPEWRIIGHRDTKATACPGDQLHPLIPELAAASRQPDTEVPEMNQQEAHQLAAAEAAAKGAQKAAVIAVDQATRAREAAEAASLYARQQQARMAAVLDHLGLADPEVP